MRLGTALAILLFLCYGCLAPGAALTAPPRIKSASDCRDHLLGEPTRSRRDANLSITLRVLDECGTEYQIDLTEKSSGELSLSTVSSSRPIDDVLTTLQQDQVDLTVEAACERVNIRSSSVFVPVAELNEIVERLEAMRIGVSPRGPLVVHGMSYDLWIFASPINESHYSFQGLYNDTSDGHPLQPWADSLIRLSKVNRCSH